jgi:toxin secretion/phage lysis holin
MIHVENPMVYLKWMLAGLAAFLHNVPELTWFLLILIAIDILFGTWAAIHDHELSSSRMWDGLTKKAGSLIIVALGAAINRFVGIKGIDFVMVFTAFYIAPELLSILRNAAVVGIPVPPQVTSVMRYFQEKDKANADGLLPKNPQ